MLNENGFKNVAIFKGTLSKAVQAALEILPEGKDKEIFIQKIEEAVFFGTRAIAKGLENHTEIVVY